MLMHLHRSLTKYRPTIRPLSLPPPLPSPSTAHLSIVSVVPSLTGTVLPRQLGLQPASVLSADTSWEGAHRWPARGAAA